MTVLEAARPQSLLLGSHRFLFMLAVK